MTSCETVPDFINDMKITKNGGNVFCTANKEKGYLELCHNSYISITILSQAFTGIKLRQGYLRILHIHKN